MNDIEIMPRMEGGRDEDMDDLTKENMDTIYHDNEKEQSAELDSNDNSSKTSSVPEPYNDGKNILDYIFVDFDSITILKVPGKGITNLKGIEKLVNLRVLDISSNALRSLKGIQKCKNLEELHCRFNYINSIKWIKDLPLVLLDFSDNNVKTIMEANLDRIDEVNGSGNPYINSNNTDSVGDEENVDLDVSDNVDDSLSESSTESALEVVEEIFILEDRHIKLINKYISKSEKFLGELGNENQMEIDVETTTLDRLIDAPILKK